MNSICAYCDKPLRRILPRQEIRISQGLPVYCTWDCWSKSRNKRKQIPCPVCGTLFTVYPSGLQEGKTNCCSNECAGIYKTKITHSVCAICNLIFLPGHGEAGLYCSWDCYSKSRNQKVTRFCQHCGIEFKAFASEVKDGGGDFCSRECYDKSRPGKVERICTVCGTSFLMKHSRLKKGEGLYCSKKCEGIARSGENNYNWKGGVSYLESGYRGPKWEITRLNIRKRDNFTCQDCGKKEEDGPAFPVHHIVPWWNFTNWRKANRHSNLVTLCLPCHMKREGKIPEKQMIFLSSLVY